MTVVDKIINEFQSYNCIPLKLKKTKILYSADGAEYDLRNKQIILPADARGSELREYVYHELGHALIQQYKIPRQFLSRFCEMSPGITRKKVQDFYEEGEPCPRGWVSWYSMVNGSEDFCETLAAYCVNQYRRRGKWDFEDYRFDVTGDIILQKKIEWVERCLLYCSQQAAIA